MKKLFLFIGFFISLFTYSQDTISTSIDEVIVNGVRASKKTPISETTIKQSDLSKVNTTFEPSNILNKTPNVTMSTDNGTPFGYTYFRIRGIDQTRINTTLNGVPLNDAEDQGVFFSNIPSFMENIKSLQIQRGVGTSSNGVSSFGGSVNFETHDYTDKNLSIKYDLGSFNTTRLTSTYSTGLKNKFALNVSGSSYTTDGYKYGSGGVGNMLYLNTGYFGEKNTLKFTSIFGTSRNGMSWMGVSEDDINNDPRTNVNKDNAWDDFKQSINILEYKRKLTKFSNFTSSVFYNKLKGGYDYNLNGSKNLFLNADYYGVINNLSIKTQDVSVDIGINLNSYKREHKYSFNHTDFYWEPTDVEVSKNYGLKNEISHYLKINMKIERFNIFYDGQVRNVTFKYKSFVIDEYNKSLDKNIFWIFYNPKGGITYNLNKSLFYYSVGLSHREPTRTNMFGSLDYLTPVNVSNVGGFNDIKPEKVIDHELGFKTFGKFINGQINLFHMSFRDEITLIGGSSPNGVLLSTSVDESYRQGIELDFKVNLTKKFYITYNESFTNAKIKNDGETFKPILTPKTIRNIGLTFENKGFLIQGLSKYQSSSYLDLSNVNTIPNFTVYDINLGYTKSKYMVMLTLGNITNEKYYTNGSMVAPDFSISDRRHLFVNPPLNFFLTLKYTL